VKVEEAVEEWPDDNVPANILAGADVSFSIRAAVSEGLFIIQVLTQTTSAIRMRIGYLCS